MPWAIQLFCETRSPWQRGAWRTPGRLRRPSPAKPGWLTSPVAAFTQITQSGKCLDRTPAATLGPLGVALEMELTFLPSQE